MGRLWLQPQSSCSQPRFALQHKAQQGSAAGRSLQSAVASLQNGCLQEAQWPDVLSFPLACGRVSPGAQDLLVLR